MTTKIRLTKSRLKALSAAVSMDDVLYEKHRRVSEDIQQQAERYLHAPKRIISVTLRQGDRHYRLRVVSYSITSDGTRLMVEK